MEQKVITPDVMNAFLEAIGLPEGTVIFVIQYDARAKEKQALLEMDSRHMNCVGLISA